MKSLSENTLIPIGLAVVVIGGGSAWLTKISIATAANSDALSRIETKQESYTEHLAEIRQDLAVIRQRIETMEDTHGRGN